MLAVGCTDWSRVEGTEKEVKTDALKPPREVFQLAD